MKHILLVKLLTVVLASGLVACGREEAAQQENQGKSESAHDKSQQSDKNQSQTQKQSVEATSLPSGVVAAYRFLPASNVLVSQPTEQSYYVVSVDAFHYSDGSAVVHIHARGLDGQVFHSMSAKSNQKTSLDSVARWSTNARARYSYDPRNQQFGVDYNLTGIDYTIQLVAVP